MKRTYEERVQLGRHAHKHTGHKPCRIDIGLHKTKRHAVNELQDHLVVEEMRDGSLWYGVWSEGYFSRLMKT